MFLFTCLLLCTFITKAKGYEEEDDDDFDFEFEDVTDEDIVNDDDILFEEDAFS